MTTFDWLDLLRDDAPRLREQGWASGPDGCLRNKSGQCPLCALAQSGTEGWHFALRTAFGSFKTSRSAEPIAKAADNREHPLRATLESILC